MKKIISFFAASLAIFATSCVKDNSIKENLEEGVVIGLSFSSERPKLDEVKTAWNGETIQWAKGDAIRVAYTCDGVWQNADGTATGTEADEHKTAKLYESTKLDSDALIAKFSVPGNFKGTASGEYQFYGVYPSSACTDAADFKSAPSLTVTIPEVQTPLADSFDPAADVMMAKSVSTFTGIPTEPVSMSWTRLVAHACFTFANIKDFGAEETISSIVLTANPEADLTGKHNMLLDSQVCDSPSSSAVTNVLTLNASNLILEGGGHSKGLGGIPA